MNTHIPFTSRSTCKPGGPLPFWRQRQCPSSAEPLWWQTWWEVALSLPPLLFFHLAGLWSWSFPVTACTFLLLSTPCAPSLSARGGERERERMTQGSRTPHEIPSSLHAGRINHSKTSITSAGRGGERAEPLFDGLQRKLLQILLYCISTDILPLTCWLWHTQIFLC